MSTPNCLAWSKTHLSPAEVAGKRIIEIGSYDVNGSIRATIEAWQPAEYIGVDMRHGPGVDVVCAAESLVDKFGVASFDVVISICTFEHVCDWRLALSNVKQICKPGGTILFIVPSRWPFHAYPNDFWRYDSNDIAHIFADSEIRQLEEIEDDYADHFLVYAKIQKPDPFQEKDLSTYPISSIITGQKVIHFNKRDFFTANFAKVFANFLLNQFKSNVKRTILSFR